VDTSTGSTCWINLCAALVQMKLAMDVETSLISRIQCDIARPHGCQQRLFAVVQPFDGTGLSTMTNGRPHRGYYLRSGYRIKLMTSRVVTAHKEIRARDGRGLKRDLQLQNWGRHAWDDKTRREVRGFKPPGRNWLVGSSVVKRPRHGCIIMINALQPGHFTSS
jgi:hypothetical protein